MKHDLALSVGAEKIFCNKVKHPAIVENSLRDFDGCAFVAVRGSFHQRV